MGNKIIATVPCYNVERFCEPLIRTTLDQVSRVIAIDDGSTDGTLSILQKLALEFPDTLQLVACEKNRGKGFALMEGFSEALAHDEFDILVTIDSDGQHDPAFIAPMVAALVEADVAIGSRNFNQMPLRSRLGNTIISHLLQSLYSFAPTDTQSGLRAFRREFIEAFMHRAQGGRFEMEFHCLIFALANRWQIREVPMSTIYIEKNRYTHFKGIRDSFKVIRVLFNHLWSTR